jgi:hypothetical protein
MPRVGFEPTTPVFERAKIIHALDRAVTVTGSMEVLTRNKCNFHQLKTSTLLQNNTFKFDYITCFTFQALRT